MNYNNIETQFKDAMASSGIVTKDAVIADGTLHRFYIDGDRKGSKNGWYVLFGDGVPAGSFGSWKTGDKGTWCVKPDRDLTTAQRNEHKRRMIEAKVAREAEEQERRNVARDKARSIWEAASKAPNDHPYLIRKGVKAFDIKHSGNRLVIPMQDITGEIQSLQFIDKDGNKRFLSGGKKKACYHLIGLPVEPFCIAEGYATAASIYEATLYPAVTAFDAGNLKPVAKAIYERFNKPEIIICADNDSNTPGNPGVTKAKEAAALVNGRVAVAGGLA